MFGSNRERMDKIPVWVRIPTFSLQLWTLEYFKNIGNFHGDFLDADMSFEAIKKNKVARILVCINVREGLGEEVDLKWGPYIHTKKLDYESVPFHCQRFH
jgi:hypothetical protein